MEDKEASFIRKEGSISKRMEVAKNGVGGRGECFNVKLFMNRISVSQYSQKETQVFQKPG